MKLKKTNKRNKIFDYLHFTLLDWHIPKDKQEIRLKTTLSLLMFMSNMFKVLNLLETDEYLLINYDFFY